MFDMKGFERAQFKPRIGTVPVPAMQAWFTDGAPAEMKVRGLTGAELALVQEAEASAKNWQAILEGMAGDKLRDKVEAVKALLGRTNEVPAQLLRRLEAAEHGLVDPALPRNLIVKMADAYPLELQVVTTEIFKLTGMGMDAGKLAGSGATPASGPHLQSGNEAGAASTNSDPTCSPTGG